MLEVEQDDKALFSSLIGFPAEFMEAIYIGSPPTRRSAAHACNGTASLVRLQQRYLCVTCDHVVEEYRRQRAEDPQTHFQIGQAVFDPVANLVSSNSRMDLAILEVPGEIIAARNLVESQFFSPVTWPPSSIKEGDVVSFAGFPGAWREQPESDELIFYIFSHGATFVHSVGEDYFYLRVEIDKCQGRFDDGKEFGDLGGLSGGPVFIWRKLHAELVGFIKEYQESLDLLLVRRANVIREDCSIID